MSQVFMSTLSNWAMYPVLMGPALDWGWSRSQDGVYLPWGTSLLSYGSSLSPFPAPLPGTWEPLRMGSLIAFPKPALLST